MDEFFDCWTVAKIRTTIICISTNGRTRTSATRSCATAIIRASSSTASGNEIHDTPQAEMAKGFCADWWKSRTPSRSDAAGDAGAVPSERQPRLRRRPGGSARRGRAELSRERNSRRARAKAVAQNSRHGKQSRSARPGWRCATIAPYAGQFLWTGIDYLANRARWPRSAAGSGLLDRTGDHQPMGYERQSWWSSAPMVAITRRVAGTRSACRPTPATSA